MEPGAETMTLDLSTQTFNAFAVLPSNNDRIYIDSVRINNEVFMPLGWIANTPSLFGIRTPCEKGEQTINTQFIHIKDVYSLDSDVGRKVLHSYEFIHRTDSVINGNRTHTTHKLLEKSAQREFVQIGLLLVPDLCWFGIFIIFE